MARALSVRAVAEELDLQYGTVLRLIHSGRLPALRVGAGPRAQMRVLREDIERFLQDAKVIVPSRDLPLQAPREDVYDDTFR